MRNQAPRSSIQRIVGTLACTPNIAGSGRRRRRQFGYIAAGLAFALAIAFIVTHVAWFVRLVVFLPTTMAAIGLLQASRSTCLAHAAKGTVEHEDFSTTPASEEEISASRLVAAGIRRDSFLIGVAAAVVAAASSWIS
jgi:hypothetical protein